MTTFLYVEDDALSREIMGMMLTSLGYHQVVMFEDSSHFLAKLETLPFLPDIIFLDIHMKPVDGFQMLQWLREHPAFANQKIIALTASVMNEEVARLRNEGFDGAIGKPLDFEMFPTLLERILRGEMIWHVV